MSEQTLVSIYRPWPAIKDSVDDNDDKSFLYIANNKTSAWERVVWLFIVWECVWTTVYEIISKRVLTVSTFLKQISCVVKNKV